MKATAFAEEERITKQNHPVKPKKKKKSQYKKKKIGFKNIKAIER